MPATAAMYFGGTVKTPSGPLQLMVKQNVTGVWPGANWYEREVFDLIVSGGTTASIARGLFISQRTVETHRSRILRKLKARSAADLVRLAARLGLLPSNN